MHQLHVKTPCWSLCLEKQAYVKQISSTKGQIPQWSQSHISMHFLMRNMSCFRWICAKEKKGNWSGFKKKNWDENVFKYCKGCGLTEFRASPSNSLKVWRVWHWHSLPTLSSALWGGPASMINQCWLCAPNLGLSQIVWDVLCDALRIWEEIVRVICRLDCCQALVAYYKSDQQHKRK